VTNHRSAQPSCGLSRTATYALFSALCVAALGISGCHRLPPPTPIDQLNAQQTRGYNVFQTHCAQCHSDRSDESLHGPALVGIFKKPYLHSGAPATDERVTATILHGRNLMPAQTDIDPQDLADLLAYLHTL
jgi:mono/diheme cytochrome c family protein